jgi:hypothetical protein
MDKMDKKSKIDVLIYNFFNSNYNANEYIFELFSNKPKNQVTNLSRSILMFLNENKQEKVLKDILLERTLLDESVKLGSKINISNDFFNTRFAERIKELRILQTEILPNYLGNKINLEDSKHLVGFKVIGNQDIFLEDLRLHLIKHKFIAEIPNSKFLKCFKNNLPENYTKITWLSDANVLHQLVKTICNRANNKIGNYKMWNASRNVFQDELGNVLDVKYNSSVAESNFNYQNLIKNIFYPLALEK